VTDQPGMTAAEAVTGLGNV